ncbi:MAG: DUF4412 domain-containing protein [Acidobacteria bacterium]|nr:MAG: DUF4412 domain-containing protein [Acidobacteriota bacterium]
MKNPLRLTLSVALLAFFLGFAPARSADLTIVSTVTAGKYTGTSTQYIGDHKVRVSNGRTETIVDYENGKVVYIDHKKKRYSETSTEEMRRHFVELEKMLDENPILSKMVGKVSEVTVERTGETRTIAGYPCEHYVLTMGKALTFDVWATRKLEIPVSYYDGRKMLYASMGPMAARFEKMLEAMKDIGGMALAMTVSTKAMGFDAESTSEATEVRIGPLPADAFAIPAGYKKGKSAFE